MLQFEDGGASAGHRWRSAVTDLLRRAQDVAASRHFPHRQLLLAAILALVLAASLVMYLERRAARLHREQEARILQQVCERTAAVFAERMRHLLDAAVLETIESVGHPQLLNLEPPEVAASFAKGLDRHPYIDRFFIWSARPSNPLPDQVLFYSPLTRLGRPVMPVLTPDGREIGHLVAEPELGREILRLARIHAERQVAFAVADRTVADVPYQIVIHLLWSDERREGFFGILGYTVNLAGLRSEMFDALLAEEIEAILDPRRNSPSLVFGLLDDRGRLVYGSSTIPGAPFATAPIDMLFFPGGPLQAWLAARPQPRIWQVMVGATEFQSHAVTSGWLVAAVVLLIFVALLCAVTVDLQAQRLSQMQSDFVANVSHQLKTPVSLLSGATQTLGFERVRSPEKLKEYIEIVRSQTVRLAGLMDQILEFSRLDAGRVAYDLETTDLGPLVERLVQRFTADRPQRSVPIRFESAPEVPPVRVDPAGLEQVVVNLLENAVNYGDERNQILVRLDAADGYSTISVSDRGTGIDRGDLPHIFDKFYRGGGHRRCKGFGLGLAIVQGIVHAHGGRIVVDSTPGVGSTFSVHLPAIAKESYHAASRPAH